MKQCKTCKVDKELDQFFNSKGNAGGKVPNCKICCKLKVNRKAGNAASKKYRDSNPNKRYELDKKYRKENPEKIKALRNRRLNERYREDPVYRLQTILRQQVVDYIKYNKVERTAELIGYTAEDFIARHGLGKDGDDLDHKIPKSWFKDDTPISVVWHIDNLHWLAGQDNRSKHNRYMTQVDPSYLQLAILHIKDEYLTFIK